MLGRLVVRGQIEESRWEVWLFGRGDYCGCPGGGGGGESSDCRESESFTGT